MGDWRARYPAKPATRGARSFWIEVPLLLHLPGHDPGVHVFVCKRFSLKTWVAGSSPAKATER
jgi:hypothetical protein